ncbi:MAG: hypothetical protein CM15mP129_00880 [Chloroflexota bacterium]|nr:MAG: hypothetical protein CM15mP129_00880 [Chloroflexota bacterium]
MTSPMNNVTSIEKSENKISISDADIVVSGGRASKDRKTGTWLKI